MARRPLTAGAIVPIPFCDGMGPNVVVVKDAHCAQLCGIEFPTARGKAG